MMKSALTFFAAFLSAATAQSAAPLSPPRTEVIAAQGFVQRQSAGFGSRRQVKSLPERLAEGQSLSCGQASAATIRFKDQSLIKLGPDSLFLLEDDKPDRTSLLLNAGKLVASVTHVRYRSFEIDTPAAVVRVVGTGFSVEAMSPEKTRVEVHAGEVAVQGRRDGEAVGEEVYLLAGQSVDVLRGEVGVPKGEPEEILNPEVERQLDGEVDRMFDGRR